MQAYVDNLLLPKLVRIIQEKIKVEMATKPSSIKSSVEVPIANIVISEGNNRKDEKEMICGKPPIIPKQPCGFGK
jgi:hypothetical protein